MKIRQWIGDIGLAIVLAVPTAALSRPQPAVTDAASSGQFAETAAIAGATVIERRFAVEG